MAEESAEESFRCSACGFVVGLFLSASCNQCGHIPEEHRA